MNSTKGRQRNLNTLMPPQLNRQELSRISSTCTDESTNSFLLEIDYNPDIDEKIRDEIDMRFNRSPTNARYKFPREQLKFNKQLPVISYRSTREKTIDFYRRKDSLINNAHRIGNISEFLNKSLKSKSPTKIIKTSPRGRIGKTPSPLSTVLLNIAPIVSATPNNLSTKHQIKHSGFPKLSKEFYRGSKSPSPTSVQLFSISQDLKRL